MSQLETSCYRELKFRVKSIPEDIYDRFAMYDMQLEDLYLPVATANPISLVAHVLQWLLLAPLFTVKDQSESILRSATSRKSVGGRWERWEDDGKVSKTGLGGGWTVRFFEYPHGHFLCVDDDCDLPIDFACMRKFCVPLH